MIREKVKNLWKLCFDDTEEYLDMYFRLRYNNDVNIAIQSGEEVIAALQMLPYPMTYHGTEINTAYISGACTHPDYRNRGVMHELLSQTFTKMLQNDIAVSTLIPAEPWLFEYYSRHGFAPVFKYRKYTFMASDSPSPKGDPAMKSTHEFKEEIYTYLNRKLKERPNCIQHTEKDFRVIMADLRLSRGNIYTLNREEEIIAVAVVYPANNGGRHIGEIVSNSPEISSMLIQRICEKKHIPAIEVYMPPTEDATSLPLGMARIINAKTMLQLYATFHPEWEANIYLIDEQVSANNGYYYLNNGKCMSSAKRLPGRHLTLTIGELTQRIFASLNPYMSLMLNL